MRPVAHASLVYDSAEQNISKAVLAPVPASKEVEPKEEKKKESESSRSNDDQNISKAQIKFVHLESETIIIPHHMEKLLLA